MLGSAPSHRIDFAIDELMANLRVGLEPHVFVLLTPEVRR